MTGPGVPLHRDPAAVSAATAALAGLAAVCRPLRAAAVLTDDGFEVARVPHAAPTQRLTSMASTLQALADAVARELRLGSTRHLQLAAEEGTVVVLRVGDRPCALVAVLDDGAGEDELDELHAAADRLATALPQLDA